MDCKILIIHVKPLHTTERNRINKQRKLKRTKKYINGLILHYKSKSIGSL